MRKLFENFDHVAALDQEGKLDLALDTAHDATSNPHFRSSEIILAFPSAENPTESISWRISNSIQMIDGESQQL